VPDISQGSVATLLRCGGWISVSEFITNVLRSLAANEFWGSFGIGSRPPSSTKWLSLW